MNCQACNHSIKRPYTWNHQTLGIECWKRIALPEILKKREEKWAEIKKQDYMKAYALVEAIKKKDFSKIKSEFKISFLKSLISQFEEKGFITSKQYEIVYGTHKWNGYFYDNGMLSKKDEMNELIARYIVGYFPREHVDYLIETFYRNPKDIKYILESIGESQN